METGDTLAVGGWVPAGQATGLAGAGLYLQTLAGVGQAVVVS